MRTFKGKHFSRRASDEGINEADLCTAAKEAFAGQVDADLGGYIFKKRVARIGSGKSGGYRTILGFKKANPNRVFFLYGFAKNKTANMSGKEQTALSTNAAVLIETTDPEIEQLKALGTIIELECVE